MVWRSPPSCEKSLVPMFELSFATFVTFVFVSGFVFVLVFAVVLDFVFAPTFVFVFVVVIVVIVWVFVASGGLDDRAE